MKKIFIVFAISVLLTACTTVPEIPHYTGVNPFYPGTGEGQSFLEALNDAKRNAVKLAVIDMIGSTEETQQQEKIKPVLYDGQNPQTFVENDYTHIIKREETVRGVYCQISIPVKIKNIRRVLEMQHISRPSDGAPTTQDLTESVFLQNNSTKTIPSGSGTAGAETSFIEHYTDNLLYMVVSSEHSKADTLFLNSAITMANKYLLDNGYRAVDYNSVEKLKEDSTALFKQEPETGDLSVVQWIAQKLGADVYIEIDGFVQGGRENSGYFGKAEINLKMYNPSTGELLGSIPYASPRTFDRASADSAAQNALKSTVFKAVGGAVEQSKKALTRDYKQGIRYEIIINNTADSKLMSRFRAKLKNQVETIRVMHQSAAQTKYAVQYFGSIEDMEDIVYAAAEAVPGLSGIELIMIRGKTLMFRSGL